MLPVLVLTIVLFSQTQAIPAPGHGALVGYCDRSDQCDVGECCVSFNQPRGRRAVLSSYDPHLMSLVHGHCAYMGTTGDKCIVDETPTGFDGLYYDPICADGYTCVGVGQIVLNKGELGTCQPSSHVQVGRSVGQPCSTGADCADTECCVSNMRPIGKRAISTCQAMGTSGSGCLVHYGSGKPAEAVFQCPCASGLTCHGNGMFDIPLGETGTCM